MKFIIFVMMTLSVLAFDPASFKSINIVYSKNANDREMKMVDQLANDLLGNRLVLKDDMLVDDEYCQRFFTFYAKRFLIVVGTRNNLFNDLQRQGLKVWGRAPYFIHGDYVNGTGVAYTGLHANPFALRNKFLGIESDTLPQCLVISGSNLSQLSKAIEAFQSGALVWQGEELKSTAGYYGFDRDKTVKEFVWNSNKLRFD